MQTVFYAWQSDTARKLNHYFIEDALKGAVERIRKDKSLEVEPVMDRDTAGVAGAPDIGKTIFGKIAKAWVFVADVTIVNDEKYPRRTPNPNVLVELGYALSALSYDRILLVMNTAYGGPELLPFDVRMKRTVQYHIAEGDADRNKKRKELEDALEFRLREIFDSVGVGVSAPSPIEIAIKAVEDGKPNSLAKVRTALDSIIANLLEIEKKQPKDSVSDDVLVESLGQTVSNVADFGRLCNALAGMDLEPPVHEVYKWMRVLMEQIFRDYFRNDHRMVGHNYWWFLGHEMFLMFVSALLENRRYSTLANCLAEPYVIKTIPQQLDAIPYAYFSGEITLFTERNRRLGTNRLSLQHDIEMQRHTESALSRIASWENMLEADLFLRLRDVFPPVEENQRPIWYVAPGEFHFRHMPEFLLEAYSRTVAKDLAVGLGAASVDELRDRLVQIQGNGGRVGRDWRLLYGVDAKKIGTM